MKRKIQLTESELINVIKRIISEQTSTDNVTTNENVETITCKVASEGIKNVSAEMIKAPAFKGWYSAYSFGGTFNGVNYEWDCNGVEGMSGVRGFVDGEISTEYNKNIDSIFDGEIDASNADPNGVFVGFQSPNTNFMVFMTTDKKPKCLYWR